MNSSPQFSIAIAGSSKYTKLMAEKLAQNSHFKILYLITPAPRPQGRKKLLTLNPLHSFSKSRHLQVILIEKKINQDVQQRIVQHPKPDFLLVVDFGYLIPTWLLDLPKIAPINIHPSKLPAWRGSSPGQMVLLNCETTSSVSLIKMNSKLDQGVVIYQKDFVIKTNWNSQNYYNFAFELISQQLSNILINFAQGKIKTQAQPIKSPTPISKKLNKKDSFINWSQLQPLLCSKQEVFLPKINNINSGNCLANHILIKKSKNQKQPKNNNCHLLQKYFTNTPNDQQAALVERAARAFAPWPGLWTIISTKKGEKRLKILNVELQNNQLCLKQVQIEGKQPCKIEEIKNWF